MSGRRIGDLELAVLLSVLRLGADAHGLSIRREVSAVRRYDYSVGAIYTTLGRLEQKGLLSSWMSDPLPIRGGRSRRHYEVTSVGHRTIRTAERLTHRLWQARGDAAEPA